MGQGFFHSGFILEDKEIRLSYVYDCGSMAAYKGERDREIDSFHRQAANLRTLDLLYLSHVHADHINGVEKLLESLAVDTIVLPLIDVVERLIAFGRTAIEDPVSTLSDFYRDFIIDPTAALSRFDPRQILFVEPSGAAGAPGGGGGSIEPPPEGPDVPFVKGRPDHADPRWILVGRGEPRFAGYQSASSSLTAIIPDTLAMMTQCSIEAITPSPVGIEWLLAPYVDQMIEGERRRFLEALASECKTTVRNLEIELTSTDFVQDLVISKIDRLAAAYAALAGNLNVTSMSLYSGPARTVEAGTRRRWECHTGNVNMNWLVDRVAWLGTGDAALKQKLRRADFLAHYKGLIDQVVTLTLPHHGSDHNFHTELVAAICPTICIAAADKYRNWKHPGAHTVQAVYSQPALLQVVTAMKCSMAFERASLG